MENGYLGRILINTARGSLEERALRDQELLPQVFQLLGSFNGSRGLQPEVISKVRPKRSLGSRNPLKLAQSLPCEGTPPLVSGGAEGCYSLQEFGKRWFRVCHYHIVPRVQAGVAGMPPHRFLRSSVPSDLVIAHCSRH